MAAGGCMISIIVFIVIPLIVVVIAMIMVDPGMGIGALVALVAVGLIFWAIFKRT